MSEAPDTETNEERSNAEVNRAGTLQFPELWKDLQDGRLDDVIAAATRLLGSSTEKESREVNKLIGMARFRQERYEEAVPFFELAAGDSEDAGEWFNLLSAATLARQIEKGAVAFERALKVRNRSGGEEQMSIPFMRLYYACALRDVGEYPRALEQIEQLRSLYEVLAITDTMFLHMRGVPFLSYTMKVAVDIFNGLGPSFDAKGWIDAFSQKLDEEGAQYLREVREQL